MNHPATLSIALILLAGCVSTGPEPPREEPSKIGKLYRSLGTVTEVTESATVRSDGTWESNLTTRSVYHSPAVTAVRALAGAAAKAAP